MKPNHLYLESPERKPNPGFRIADAPPLRADWFGSQFGAAQGRPGEAEFAQGMGPPVALLRMLEP